MGTSASFVLASGVRLHSQGNMPEGVEVSCFKTSRGMPDRAWKGVREDIGIKIDVNVEIMSCSAALKCVGACQTGLEGVTENEFDVHE